MSVKSSNTRIARFTIYFVALTALLGATADHAAAQGQESTNDSAWLTPIRDLSPGNDSITLHHGVEAEKPFTVA